MDAWGKEEEVSSLVLRSDLERPRTPPSFLRFFLPSQMALPTAADHGTYLGLSPGIDGPASTLLVHPTEELLLRGSEVDNVGR